MSVTAALGWLSTTFLLGGAVLHLRRRRLARAGATRTSVVLLAAGAALLLALLLASGGSLSTLLGSTALYTGIAGLLSAPLVLTARRHRRFRLIRRVAVATGTLGLLCGMLAANSERLVDQCRDAIIRGDCVDYGASGLQFVLVAGFGIIALLQAYWLHTD